MPGWIAMAIDLRIAQLEEIAPFREQYRKEMSCQIIHDSIHGRPGWTREYALVLDGMPVGYGSLAVDGPWQEKPALYEFYVQREYRMRIFDLFAGLLTVCDAKTIETQSNDRILTVMLHTFAHNLRAESIIFEDAFKTQHQPAGARFRARARDDTEALREQDLDDGAGWVVTVNGRVAGAGGVLYHYNWPYGDLYMKIAEPFRRRGLGTYLVQELKTACRAKGRVPAARCNVQNLPSRKTLQRAGFVPCGNIVTGDLPE
jgi:GNAT superfamily N-acetyltransferase